jgi:hypothetical protein
LRQVDDPVATLERWAAYGAHWRIIGLSATHTKVELCSCHGEPVAWFESSDEDLVAYVTSSSHDGGS